MRAIAGWFPVLLLTNADLTALVQSDEIENFAGLFCLYYFLPELNWRLFFYPCLRVGPLRRSTCGLSGP